MDLPERERERSKEEASYREGILAGRLGRIVTSEKAVLIYLPSFVIWLNSIKAETSTGCLFAGSAVGQKGVSAEDVAAEAATFLVQNLLHGGCVDE